MDRYTHWPACLMNGMAISMLLVSLDAVAQEIALEEIIVTAERREADIQDTPVTVTALTAATLDNLQVANTIELDRTVPNLSVRELTANPSTFNISLRGNTESVGGLSVSESNVGVYVDDVYRGRLAGANLTFNDIERIEVLRGPQGTLYGRNTIAGAIKIVSRKPVDESWVDVSAGYGDWDHTEFKGSIGGPIVDDTWAASFSMIYMENGGYKFNRAIGEDVGAMENVASRVILNYLGSDTLDMTLTAFVASDDNDGYIPTPATYGGSPPTTSQAMFATGNIYTSQSTTPSRGKTDQWSITLNISYDAGAFEFRSITGYMDLEDLFRADFTGGREFAPGVYGAGFDRTALANHDQFTQEFQLLGTTAGERLDWLAGLFYFTEAGDQVINDKFGTFPLLPTTFDLKTDSYAVFGQLSYEWNSRVSIIGGLRYTQDSKSMDATIQDGLFVFPVTLAAVSLDEDFSSISPKLGVDVQWNDDTLVYAYVAHGFKGGGFNGLAVGNPLILASPYNEETVWTLEGGVKTDLLDNRLRINAAVFYNRYDDIQMTAIIDVASFSFAEQNVGKATVLGLEIEASARLSEGLTVFGNAGFMTDRYDRLDPLSSAAQNNAADLPSTPAAMGMVGFSYEQPIAASGADLKLQFGADVGYVGDHFGEVTNSVLVESYAQINAYVAIGSNDDRWQLRLAGKNVSDEQDLVFGSTASTGSTAGPPRFWLLSARLRY